MVGVFDCCSDVRIAGVAIAVWQTEHWPLDLACSQSAVFLLLLNLSRKRLDRTTLRAAADLALLSPLLLLPFLQR